MEGWCRFQVKVWVGCCLVGLREGGGVSCDCGAMQLSIMGWVPEKWGMNLTRSVISSEEKRGFSFYVEVAESPEELRHRHDMHDLEIARIIYVCLEPRYSL